ncbi:MAG: hypothetical protein WDW36_002348 [Sanguina aurantia]
MVFAKGKGGRRGGGMSGMPGGQQSTMVRKEPPVPEVDPDNAEFVIFVRAGKKLSPGVGWMPMPINEAKWIPLTVLKLSGTAGNYLVKAQSSPFGQLLFSQTLVKQISNGLYKDKEQLETQIMKGEGSPFKDCKDFSYAFKIRDKAFPAAWLEPERLTVIPPEVEVAGTAVDSLQKFFSIDNFRQAFGGPMMKMPTKLPF